MIITREEWERRYAARMVEVGGLHETHALEVAKVGADTYEEDEGYPAAEVVWWGGPASIEHSTPEDVADEEMSCWSDDGPD